VSRRRRKTKKRHEKRLEKIPEKLQRKRERRVTYRIRGMPSWIRNALVVAVIASIIIGVIIIVPKPPAPVPELEAGDIYFIENDVFFCSITNGSQVNIDYMEGWFGVGTRGGEQPLHINITDTFDNPHNFSLLDSVIYDYYGNAYVLNSNTTNLERRQISFNIGNIGPSIDNEIDLGGNKQGYYSLRFGYLINSSNDVNLFSDDLQDIFSTNFTITIENSSLIYNQTTTVHCDIFINSLSNNTENFNQFSKGRLHFEIPRQIYNESEIIANLTLVEQYPVGISEHIRDPEINNDTHIIYDWQFDLFDHSDNWGISFDLNVTAFTNNSFILLDFTDPINEIYLESGPRISPTLFEQPLHEGFDPATVNFHTPINRTFEKAFTDIYIAFPQVWVSVSPPPTNSTVIPEQPIVFSWKTPQRSRTLKATKFALPFPEHHPSKLQLSLDEQYPVPKEFINIQCRLTNIRRIPLL
jgi:hypothetical protein